MTTLDQLRRDLAGDDRVLPAVDVEAVRQRARRIRSRRRNAVLVTTAVIIAGVAVAQGPVPGDDRADDQPIVAAPPRPGAPPEGAFDIGGGEWAWLRAQPGGGLDLCAGRPAAGAQCSDVSPIDLDDGARISYQVFSGRGADDAVVGVVFEAAASVEVRVGGTASTARVAPVPGEPTWRLFWTRAGRASDPDGRTRTVSVRALDARAKPVAEVVDQGTYERAEANPPAEEPTQVRGATEQEPAFVTWPSRNGAVCVGTLTEAREPAADRCVSPSPGRVMVVLSWVAEDRATLVLTVPEQVPAVRLERAGGVQKPFTLVAGPAGFRIAAVDVGSALSNGDAIVVGNRWVDVAALTAAGEYEL